MKKIIIAAVLVVFTSSLFAQCPSKYGADSVKCREQVSLFDMTYKAKNYKEAYESWRYIVTSCPCAWDGVFTRANTLIESLIKDEQDSLRREQLIDTLIYSYDVRNEAFPEKFSKGSCMGFKAYYQMKYRAKASSQDELMEILNQFIQSVELEKEKTQPNIWDKYFQLATWATKAKKDTSYVIDAYGRATDYLDISINNALVKYESQVANLEDLNAKLDAGTLDRMEYDKQSKTIIADTARQMKLVSNYRTTLSKMEKGVAPYASCEVLEELYSQKLPTVKDDISAVNKMITTMSKSGCITNPTFKEALEIVHRNNPNRGTAYWMGMLSLRSYGNEKDNSELDKAITYFQDAVNLSETNEQKADANYMLAVAYQTKLAYSEARAAAYAALKAQPNMGKAYILIGKLYATSGGRCSGEDIPLACSWAAADKYAKAVAVDPSCANEANAERAKLRFPAKEELFKRGLSAGQSYHVGCWIQENTTVR